MIEELNCINQELKKFLLEELSLERKGIIEFFTNNKNEYNQLDSLDKISNVSDDILMLSFFNDNEVASFMESLGVNSYVTKYFVSLKDVFDELDKLSVNSKFLIPYTFIFDLYCTYSQMFFNIQLCYNFGINYSKMLTLLKRQEKNNKLPQAFEELHKKWLDNKYSMNDEILRVTIPVSDDSLVSSMKKLNRFQHKVYFRELYDKLYLYNEGIIINTRLKSDFKCDFYDLFKILYRDKMFFKNDDEKELTYGKPGNRRFKIKQVERLILS
jgi:hypothetical protein